MKTKLFDRVSAAALALCMALSLVTVAPVPAKAEEYTFTPASLTVGADKDVIANGTELVADKMYAYASPDIVKPADDALRKRNKSDNSVVTSIETGKDGLSGVRIEVSNDGATLKAQLCSTGGSNTSSFALLGPDAFDIESNIVAEDKGQTTVTGTGSGIEAVWSDLPAGTYRLISNGGTVNGRGVRILKLILDDESAGGGPVTTTYTFSPGSLTVGADKDVIANGTSLTGDKFVAYASADIVKPADDGLRKRNKSDNSAVTSIETGKDGLSGVSIVVEGTATLKAQLCSTGGSNTSSFALLGPDAFDIETNIVAEDKGQTTVTGTGSGIEAVWSDLPAGTYRLISNGGTVNGRGVRILSLSMEETVAGGGAVVAENVEWNAAHIYEGGNVTLSSTASGTIMTVVVTGPIVGKKTIKGGDDVTYSYTYATGVDVTLLKGGTEIDTQSSADKGTTQTVKFNLTDSGTYTFKVSTTRKDETPLVETNFAPVTYSYPLAVPAIASATSTGNGTVTVKWGKVHEATGYKLYVDGTEKTTVTGGDKTEYVLEGLTVGSTVSITVTALRGSEETAKSAAAEVEVTSNAQREWGWTYWGERPAYNPTTPYASANCSYELSNGGLNEPGGSVSVKCIDESKKGDGIGKIVLKSCNEGVFYYTPIPTSLNFTAKARIHVNKWRLSNGQEGFGMAVMDRVADPGRGVGFWTNGYYAIATKTAYNGQNTGIRYENKLGWAMMYQTGVTPENLSLMEANDTATINTYYKANEAKDAALENWADEAGFTEKEVNVVANHVGKDNTPETLPTSIDELKDEIIVEIKRDNTGWLFTSYDAKTGAQMKQIREYGTTALDQLDKDYVYLGFLAARGGDITVSDFEITTIRPEDDAPAEEHPITAITPKATFASATVSNSPDYTLGIAANAIGTATIALNGESILSDVPVRHDIRCDIPLTLVEGENSINVAFYPGTEEEQEWPDEYTILKNRNPSVFTATVKYNPTYSRRVNLYVAPDGSSNGGGTIQSPMLLTRAVEVAQPGQTIVLMEGTYYLDEPVNIQRGIDGTAEKPIRLVADPYAATRPVIDFQYACQGISLAGSYWYLQGFDVVHTSNNEEALAISGSYNTVDRCRFYDNRGSGMQISRLSGSDSPADWPSYNYILNCDSWNNSDLKYEDADGFAAKLTCGPGNVFDGCVSHHNADDGWDLYAKVETGPIGSVLIKNSVAYANGFLMDGTNAGNGNGFKMGGESLTGYHTLVNSYAFYNKAKGIDSNSCPDIQVYNSVSWNNGSNNVAFYTNNASKTDFLASGIISIKDASADEMPGKMLSATSNKPTTVAENFKPVGSQDKTKYENATNYFYQKTVGQAINSAKDTMTPAIFKSTAFTAITRNADGTINMGDFLQFADDANIPEGVGPTGDSTPSVPVTLAPEAAAEGGAGGGGAAGGGAAAPSDDKTGDTTTPAPVVVEPVTVAPAASVDKNGNATVTVTNKVVNDAVKKAADTGADSLVIAPAAKGEVNSMAVTIPADSVAAIANKSDMDVTVKSDVADVTISNDALTELAADKAGALTVTAAKGEDGTVKVEVATAKTTLDTVPGGIGVAVPADKGNVMVIVDAEGNEKVLVKSVVDGDKVAAKLPGSATVKVVDLSKSFEDVPAGHWAKSAVDFASARDIFKGTSETTFAPSDNVNRAMMATVLFRLEEAAAEAGDVFADVAADTWYTDAVAWANKAGIVTGYSDSAFGPNDPVTREQMATMLFRYAKTLGLDTSVKGSMTKYTDAANVSSWANEAMTWAVGAGLINGTSATTLNPDLTASRAEVAIILERMVKLIVK